MVSLIESGPPPDNRIHRYAMNVCPALSALADLLDRRNDVGISAAATDVTAHELFYRSIIGTAWLLQQRNSGHDLTRSAITALVSIVGKERRLHGMHCLRCTQALDGCDLFSIMHDSEVEA